MIGTRHTIRPTGRDEAEKPFWISFADLMSALMVLFLIVMTVALLAVTKTVDEADQKRKARDHDIDVLLDSIESAAGNFSGISVDRSRNVIDFGDRARFDSAKYSLTGEQAKLLRAFVPRVIDIARDPLGEKWLKRIVVEGFTDSRGSYLFNLNLSLERSQSVICALMADPLPEEPPMSSEDQDMIRELFLVGGYSFNSAKPNLEESRRIELRLEFFELGEVPHRVNAGGTIGECALR